MPKRRTLGRDPFAALGAPAPEPKKKKRTRAPAGAPEKKRRAPRARREVPEAVFAPPAPAPEPPARPEPPAPRVEAQAPPARKPAGSVESGLRAALSELVSAMRLARGTSAATTEPGYDPVIDAVWRPMVDFLYERYWRVECVGAENVPAQGRVLLVANHSGALPFDGVILRHAIEFKRVPGRPVRTLTEDFFAHAPLWLAPLLTRTGMVLASQQNALSLLERDLCVGVFPEGVRGLAKPYHHRYRLQAFGRGGFIRVALRSRAPLVPVAIVGAEESFPILANVAALGKPFGLPFLPITPLFPWLGPLGLVPLPTRWRLHFGPLLELTPYGPEHADNEATVSALTAEVHARVQENLDRALATRRSIWRRG